MADEQAEDGGPIIPDGVRELTDISYATWKQHPVSRVFFQYLHDAREAIKRLHMEAWEAGANIDPLEEKKAQARVEQFEDLLKLEAFHITENFYGIKPPSNVEKGNKQL